MNDNTPLVLLVDDKPDNLDLLVSYLEDAGIGLSVALNGEEALELVTEQPPDLILLDIMMPGLNGFETCQRLKANPQTGAIPVLFMSALSDTPDKIKGFAAGGVDYLTKPLEQSEVLARVNTHLTLHQQQQALENKNQDLERLNRKLAEEIKRRNKAETAVKKADARLSALSEREAKRWGIDAFIGNSDKILGILNEIRRLQQSNKTNVLILGESGTGKELIARAIHFGSRRARYPFIAVNCSAIPHELADAEFFGHVKGAFTGALNNRQGHFEQADKGTLFLDEIGDMPLLLQAKLLRVLENQCFTPVGGNREQRVDVRVISATNADLPERISNKDFRNDLYFRLAGYVVYLPPLHEHKEDVPALVSHFLNYFSTEMGRTCDINEEALTALCHYAYPGNVRELKNLIEYALISSDGGMIQHKDLHFMSAAPIISTTIANNVSASTYTDTSQNEIHIFNYLAEHPHINNTQCQQLLNISHHRASYLLKKLHKDGRLKKQGERRWAVYVLNQKVGDD